MLNIILVILRNSKGECAAVTEGGSAYDEKGFGLKASLYAKTTNSDNDVTIAYKNFTGSTTLRAITRYLKNAKTYSHDCLLGWYE